MADLKNTTISDTGFLELPAGGRAQRPSVPQAGQIRYARENFIRKIEIYNPLAGEWTGIGKQGVIATGGDSVYDVNVDGTTYRVHVFTTTGTSSFTVNRGGEVEYLIVAGGGGGGGSDDFSGGGGGGGAGGLLAGTTTVTPQAYTITVGIGSTRPNTTTQTNGNNSSAFGLTAIGGGAGVGRFINGTANGGSGGGQHRGSGPGTGTSGQGNNGGIAGRPGSASGGGGGGGGAGQIGQAGSVDSGGTGGAGVSSNISGISTFYAGGGGGGKDGGGAHGLGGIGGGGDSHPTNDTSGKDGVPNTGGGGGGGSSDSDGTNFWSNGSGGRGGNGGSGIVIIRYPLRQENPVTAAGRIVSDGLVLDLDLSKPIVYSGSGTTITDSRLNGISGTVFNSPSFNNPRTHRSVFNFNGSNNYIDTGKTAAQLGIFDADYTFEAWVFPTNLSGDRSIFGTDTLALRQGLHLIFRNGTIYQGHFSEDYTAGSATLNAWNHITYTYARGPRTARIYKNGVEQGGGRIESFIGTTNILIGRWGGNARYFAGQGGVYKIYNRFLTAEEVAQNFNATRWRFGV